MTEATPPPLTSGEIAPCPFCHGEAVAVGQSYDAGENRGWRQWWWAHCLACFARSDRQESRSLAIAAWNRRTPPSTAGWLPISTALAAWSDVIAERRRQIEVEGWHREHDDALHDNGSLALAAACYAMFASVSDRAREATDIPGGLTKSGEPIKGWAAWLEIWPWDRKWWKPKGRRRDLVRAGALIIAEIERLDRLSKHRDHPAHRSGE